MERAGWAYGPDQHVRVVQLVQVVQLVHVDLGRYTTPPLPMFWAIIGTVPIQDAAGFPRTPRRRMSHVAAAAQAALFTKNTAQNQQSAIQPASGNVGNIGVLANAS